MSQMRNGNRQLALPGVRLPRDPVLQEEEERGPCLPLQTNCGFALPVTA